MHNIELMQFAIVGISSWFVGFMVGELVGHQRHQDIIWNAWHRCSKEGIDMYTESLRRIIEEKQSTKVGE